MIVFNFILMTNRCKCLAFQRKQTYESENDDCRRKDQNLTFLRQNRHAQWPQRTLGGIYYNVCDKFSIFSKVTIFRINNTRSNLCRRNSFRCNLTQEEFYKVEFSAGGTIYGAIIAEGIEFVESYTVGSYVHKISHPSQPQVERLFQGYARFSMLDSSLNLDHRYNVD